MTTPEARARQAASGPARRRSVRDTADRVFDGTRVLEGHAVAISEDKITAVAPAGRLSGPGERIRFAGTLLPGFIELHAHLRLGQVPPDVVLRHGLTAVPGDRRPAGAALGRRRAAALAGCRADPHRASRLSGPGVRPASALKWPIFRPPRSSRPARCRRRRVHQDRLGAGRIAGAPWTSGHQPAYPPPWPVMALGVARAIVGEAHAHGLIVSVHLSGSGGAALAQDAGADEWPTCRVTRSRASWPPARPQIRMFAVFYRLHGYAATRGTRTAEP